MNPITELCYYLKRFVDKEYNKAYLRRLYKSLGAIGKNSKLTEKVIAINANNIFIGDNSYINGGMIYAGKNSRITIGNDCLISYSVHIRCVSHTISDPNKLINQQGEWEKDIIIGNNVWIGFGVQILPGITIGDNSIIGAGAVVTKDVKPNEVFGGIPAHLIHTRI